MPAWSQGPWLVRDDKQTNMYAEETHLSLPAWPVGAAEDSALTVAFRPGTDYCLRRVLNPDGGSN